MLVFHFELQKFIYIICSGSCNATQFQCQNRQCVDVSRVCDHVVDCSDYSDEFGCGKFNSLQALNNLHTLDQKVVSVSIMRWKGSV